MTLPEKGDAWKGTRDQFLPARAILAQYFGYGQVPVCVCVSIRRRGVHCAHGDGILVTFPPASALILIHPASFRKKFDPSHSIRRFFVTKPKAVITESP